MKVQIISKPEQPENQGSTSTSQYQERVSLRSLLKHIILLSENSSSPIPQIRAM